MRVTNIKLTVSILCFILISVFAINGCKKSPSSTESENERDELLEIYKKKLANESKTFTQELNIEGKGFYGDIDGNRITGINPPGFGILASSCPEVGESEFDQVFVSLTSELTCGTGYRFQVKYKITSEFYPVMSVSSTQFSFGRIRLKNSSGTIIYTTPFAERAPLLSIQNNGVVGQNSVGADLNEFIITYRTGYVSESTFNNATSLEPMFFVYTDCTNYPTQQIPFSAQQSASGSQQNTLPCLRIDKVYFNPRMGMTPASLSGTNPCLCGPGCFPSGYVFPNKQSIEFKNSNNEWKPFFLKINGLAQPGVSTQNINYWDVFYIDVQKTVIEHGLVTGNVQVRFRNNHNVSANGGPCVTQPDGTYVVETWYVD